MMLKFSDIDQKSKDFRLKKEKEKKVNFELEAIKKRERLEEAKRLERMKQYNRQKKMDKIEEDRSKSVMIMSKRDEILSIKKKVNNQARIYQEQIKNKINEIKIKMPDKISKVKVNSSMSFNKPVILDLSIEGDKKKVVTNDNIIENNNSKTQPTKQITKESAGLSKDKIKENQRVDVKKK